MDMATSLTRRDLAGAAGTLAAGAVLASSGAALVSPRTALASSAGDAPSASADGSGGFDVSSDVVVVGAGGAGLVSALVAARSGATVTVVEAADLVGGNTVYSSGVIQAAGTDLQHSSAGVEGDTPADHAEFYLQAGEGQLDEDLVRTICDDAPACIEFMQDLGVVYDTVYGNGTIPFVDPDLQKPRIHLASGTDAQGNSYGAWHVAALKSACDEAGCTLVTGQEVVSLLRDQSGRVTGVRDSEGTTYGADRGVILCTCSFDRSPELARAFSEHMVHAIEDGRLMTAPTNTGRGILMGMSVSAALTGFGGFIGLGNNVGGTPTLPGSPQVPGILVNKYGRRFVSESDHYAWVLKCGFAQEDRVMWSVFDSRAAELGGTAVGGIQPLPEDLGQDDGSGEVLSADTLEELAELMDVPAENLAEAVDTWNRDIAAGSGDTQFPTREAGMEPIDRAPFFAVRNYDFNLGAVGGLRVDPSTQQVLDTQGDPIPGLFAAGQVVGGFMGSFYPGTGTGILATVSMGRTAGAAVVA